MVQNSGLRKVKPAIFNGPGSGWGWVRLVELVEIMNAMKPRVNMNDWTPQHVLEAFRDLSHVGRFYIGHFFWLGRSGVVHGTTTIEKFTAQEPDLVDYDTMFIAAGFALDILAVYELGCVRLGREYFSDDCRRAGSGCVHRGTLRRHIFISRDPERNHVDIVGYTGPADYETLNIPLGKKNGIFFSDSDF